MVWTIARGATNLDMYASATRAPVSDPKIRWRHGGNEPPLNAGITKYVCPAFITLARNTGMGASSPLGVGLHLLRA